MVIALPITYHALREDGDEVVAIATRLGRKNAYDAAYLAPAQRLGAELWTFDGRSMVLSHATPPALGFGSGSSGSLGLRLRRGQPDGEGAGLAEHALDGDSTALDLDQFSRDRQPQPGAAVRA
jgi:hypothetical protein